MHSICTGSGFSFTCPHCHQENTCSLGFGMLFSPKNLTEGYSDYPPLLKSLISPFLWNQAESLCHQGWTIPDGQHGYLVYFCPSCGRVQNRYAFVLRKGDAVWEPQFRCGTCYAGLIPYLRDEEEEPLPVPEGVPPVYLCEHCKQFFPFPGPEVMFLWD